MKDEHYRPITIAIYPNTYGFGYVVYENLRELIDYGIAKVRPVENEKSLKRVIRLITYYQPTLVVLQEYSGDHGYYSKRLRTLIDSIKTYAEENKILIKQYSRKQIQEVFEMYRARTKYQIAQAILTGFPALKNRTPRNRKPWQSEDYNMGVFDALALALAHSYFSD